MQRAQAGDSTLNARSDPVNKHRDPEALEPERKRNQNNGGTELTSKGHRLYFVGDLRRLGFGDALSPPHESSSTKSCENLETMVQFVTCQITVTTLPGDYA